MDTNDEFFAIVSQELFVPYYTANRQIVAISLDLSTRYTGHILQGEGLCVSLSLEHPAVHTANQSARNILIILQKS